MTLANSIAHGSRRKAAMVVDHLNQAAVRSAQYSERHFTIIGMLTTLIPAAYVVDHYVGRPFFDTLVIRLVAFGFSIPLILHRVKPFREWTHFHLYFVALVAYTLPFTFGLMLVLNAASAPRGQEIELLWILQYFVALFLFIQLIHHAALATVLWVGSTIAATSSIALLPDINWGEINRVIIYPISVYVTALGFGIITNRNVDYVNSEKLRAASAIGGNIAHELRTPLASIRSLARAVNKHSRVLVDTYARAKQTGIHTAELTEAQIDGLRAALDLIEREVCYSNTVIDMLLLNTSERVAQPNSNDVFCVSEAVAEAIGRFPFNNPREKSLITVHVEKDFWVHTSKLLVVHVLFNLIKNGIYFAQKSPGAKLNVSIGSHRDKPCVNITDSGPGMSPARKKRVFERFYTTSDAGQGAGIGLSFCKTVMEAIGGEIQCESREGEFTTFRLIFPSLGHDARSDRAPDAVT